MNETNGATGRCLCGKVSFRLQGPATTVDACHCEMCRRWCGGPFLALHGQGPVHFEGEEHIVRYRSSDWAERGFCGKCGSNLFYRLVGTDEVMPAAGALDDQSGLTFSTQVFIDEKPAWYAFTNDTRTMTGAEIFALYAPKDGEKD